MRILCIFAHPSRESFNGALLDAFVSGVDTTKHACEVVDLYADHFNPLLGDELRGGAPLPDVLRYQEKITRADLLVFISPTWWYGEPAILKGFFDRVLTKSFAFIYRNKYGIALPVGLLKGKRALWVKTMNSPAWWYYALMGNWMIRTVRRGVLEFCGLRVQSRCITNVILRSKEDLAKECDWMFQFAQKL